MKFNTDLLNKDFSLTETETESWNMMRCYDSNDISDDAI